MQPVPRPAPVDRRWTALLRARAARLLRALPRRRRLAARFLLPLLQCSFRHPGLADPAPGVEGLGNGRRWGELARFFGLPLPHAAQHGRRLVRSIWLLGDGELLVVPQALAPHELRNLQQRVAVAERLLGHHEVRVRLCEEEIDPAAFLFGGLLAGAAPEVPEVPLSPAFFAERAPTPVASLFAAMVRRADPIGHFLDWAVNLPARWLADGELFTALWARWDDGAGTLPLEALAIAAESAHTRKVARRLTGGVRPLVDVGHDLCLAIARQRRFLAPALVRELRGDMLASGMPAALLPALRRSIAAGVPLEEPPPTTGVRAALRHLALRSRLGLPPAGDAFWRRLGERLQRPAADGVVAEIAFEAGEGAPFDPLNRGAALRLGLGPGRFVRMRQGRVAAPRTLEGAALLEKLVHAASAGVPCDLVPATPAAAVAVGRIDRLLRRCREADALAFEAGGAVQVVRRRPAPRIARLSRERFLARPRRLEVDEDGPLLGALAGDAPPRSIQCVVVPDAHAAWVLYGAEGSRFGERVPLARLDAHLRETRALLEGDAALLLRQAGELPLAVAPPAGAPVPVEVGGDLVRGLWIEVLGERFGVGYPWRWAAAASAIAAAWPVGTSAPLAFPRVAVHVAGRRATPLERLWARSIARRRLSSHIARVLGT